MYLSKLTWGPDFITMAMTTTTRSGAQIAHLPSHMKQLPGVPFLPRKTLRVRGDVTYPRSHEDGQAQALCSDGSYPAPAAAPGLDSLVPTFSLSIPLPTPCFKSQGPRSETETIDCSIWGLGKPNSSLPSAPLSRGSLCRCMWGR